MKWNRVVSRCSAYARAESHLVQHTASGAIVTLLGLATALLMLFAEVREFRKPHTLTSMAVDTDAHAHLRLSFNLTFPSLPCPVLSLDAADVSGERMGDSNVAKNGEIHKIRLSPAGAPIGLSEYIAPRHYGFMLRRPREEVRLLNEAVEAHEGCNIFGWLDVQRVQGNFHISVHVEDYLMLTKTQHSIAEALQAQLAHLDGGMHAIQVPLPTDANSINVSHHIHHLAFGADFPGKVNPLDGFDRMVDKGSGTFKYFLKVVPTIYKQLTGPATVSNQYSVTEYYSPARRGEMILPSVWFMYDLSPIVVTLTAQRTSVGHLLVRICAVVGGCFAVTGMLDKWVHAIITWLVPQMPQTAAA